MYKKLVYLVLVSLMIAATGSLCQAAVAPITSVTTDRPPGSPPYKLKSITVGAYTVNVSDLRTGTSTTTLNPVGGVALPLLDDLEIGTQYSASEPTDQYKVYLFGGKRWIDSNGNNPDFFLFEAGGQDNPVLAAILPGGARGQTVTIPATDSLWGSIGAGYNAPSNAQQIYGVSFAITDLLDANGQRLTNNSIIEGLAVTDRAGLDPSEWCAVVSGPIKAATSPSPADGALYTDTWVSLGWTPGETAVSHDVYLSDNQDNVTNGTGDAFRGNQTGTFFVAGFPGFPYPDGLVPGTTYYWRIDEVEANGTTKYKGPVWRFSIPPKTAYNPSPPDGAKFIALDPTLSWTGGFGTKLHTVYFGNNLDTVSNAAGGLPQGTTSYKPAGPLQPDTTYYWRVDEFDAVATYKGDVWSFTTAKAGGGVKGQYHKGMNFESLVLTRTDPQINFNWGNNAPDPIVGVDSFSVRWTGEVEAAFTETYTFYTNSDDGVRLWIDGQQLVNNWTDHGATENNGKINLVAGNTYSLQMEYYENGGGAVAELRWSSPRTPKQLIPQAALSPPVKASAPKPGNGATGTSLTPVLTWNPGDFAASHEVYFGMDAQAVKNAGKTSPEYKGSKALGNESYSPGKLAWQTTYYWRVDEVNNVNPNSPWVGNVWSFTTGDFLLIDDFEGYNAGANQIWYSWHDGLGYGAPGAPPYFAGNGTGSAVGDETTASFTEQTIVHGGRQSMPIAYDNNKQGKSKYSEAELTLTYPRDWTEEGVTVLSLWFYGNSANSSERMYVSIANRTGTPAVVYNDAANATTMEVWRRWVIPIQAFATQGINLKDVDKFVIGFGTKGSTAPGGTGKVYIDDIGLYRSASEPEEIPLEAEAGSITAPMKTYNDPLASGGKHIGTDDGIGDQNNNPPATGVATYNFTALGGVYKIALRVKPDLGNSVWVQVAGATSYSPGTHSSGWIRFNDIAAGANWHWDEVHSSDHGNEVVSITLPAGQNTLQIAYREDGAQVDAIVIMGVE